jgi:hypothetical protein
VHAPNKIMDDDDLLDMRKFIHLTS